MKHRLRHVVSLRAALISVLTALTLIAATGAASAAQGQAGDAAPKGARYLATINPSALPADPPVQTRTDPVASGRRCGPTAPDSRERAKGAVRYCVSTSPKPAARAAASTASGQQSAAATCSITKPGQWTYSRFSYCVSGLTVLYTLYNESGTPLGTGTLDVATNATLPAEGTTWDENVTVTMTGATGQVTGLVAKFRSSCSSPCTATATAPWFGNTALAVGDSLSGHVSYSSRPAPDTSVEFTTSYTLYVTTAGATPVDPSANWSNPEKIRCDDAVRDVADPTGTAAPGCVVPSVMAVVPMSTNRTVQGSPTSGQGAAAAAYWWAQRNLVDRWGLDKPLTRAKEGEDNRTAVTCGDLSSKPFVPASPIPTDTCGAFPFSSTHEGGSDGALCAEIIPTYSRGGWNILELDGGTDPDPDKPCMRAHVPLADYQSAQEKLTTGYKDQRVLEAEQFKVDITRPTISHHDCLNNVPDGVDTANGGWIDNTTEPVEHVNKTTTPLGPAGSRAAMAQACLVPQMIDTGSEAEGDITGWQDAQLFAQQNSSGTGLPPGTGLARCHLIANILGGKGGTTDGGADNLVPCWHVGMNIGTPSMRTDESAIQQVLDPKSSAYDMEPGDAIFYQVTPYYQDSTSTIPQGVTMTGTVERADGTTEALFVDDWIANTQGNGQTGLFNLGN